MFLKASVDLATLHTSAYVSIRLCERCLLHFHLPQRACWNITLPHHRLIPCFSSASHTHTDFKKKLLAGGLRSHTLEPYGLILAAAPQASQPQPSEPPPPPPPPAAVVPADFSRVPPAHPPQPPPHLKKKKETKALTCQKRPVFA